MEDCRHLSRRLELDPLATGERVLRILTRLMAGMRRIGRQGGKSDLIDALAVARAALREPSLPLAKGDGPDQEDLVTLRVEVLRRQPLPVFSTHVRNRWVRRPDRRKPLCRTPPGNARCAFPPRA